MAANLRPLGALLQANPARILLGLSACLLLVSLAIRSAKLDGRLASWLQRDHQLDQQLEHAQAALADGSGTTGQLLLQTGHDNMLSAQAFMLHLEALAVATHLSVDLFDVTWTLKDLCFTPTLPDYEGLHVSLALDNMMPCVIKTPLDCFWEGAKLHGPEQPVSLGALGLMPKWTTLNPMPMVEALQQNHPHASFPYAALLAWMHRVGITSGYQLKPCLDPSDPNCPDSAPNKPYNKPLEPMLPHEIGAALSGGCRGVAAAQMHWRQDEILGAVQRNTSSGHIVKVEALQSTIELMGEQDMYDYWRKTAKVQDINNWTAEKARLVLESWQRRLQDELAHFARTSLASSSFKIHTITSKSSQEPMDANSLLDLTNLEYCFILMTLFTCLAYPPFPLAKSRSLNLLKSLVLATVTSSAVGLTLVASLGMAAFVDLPFNMATLQILPPLGLLYGFGQNLMVAEVFSRRFKQDSLPTKELTFDCLNEILPMILLESLIYSVSLAVASIIPIAATRTFTMQAFIHVLLTSLSSLLLIPSVIVTFISCRSQSLDAHTDKTQQDAGVSKPRIKPRVPSPFRFSAFRSGTKLAANDKFSETFDAEQIFSRIQDDLQHIRVDSHQSTNINFSAHLNTAGVSTTFNFTTSHAPSHTAQTYTLPNITTNGSKVAPSSFQPYNRSDLPDLLASIAPRDELKDLSIDEPKHVEQSPAIIHETNTSQTESLIIRAFNNVISHLAINRISHMFVAFLKICSLVAMITQVKKINYGLSLTDIVAKGTVEHESFHIQETYFPIYNIFSITQGNFDYPANQHLLHQYYQAFENVEGIVQTGKGDKPKFWLINFRDWLQELQQTFDAERNKSLISSDGWTEEASDFAKLAYKLLAQTGKADNPIDKSLVESNRLVDSKGIINQKAFYYYLGAWVMNDPFTYATSEANFKPEPKIWNYNQDDLRVEKARPLLYAQIPLLLKLPANNDNLKTISDMKRISETFEALNLPNLLTGVPFIFWDQFINLELLVVVAAICGLVAIFMISVFLLSDLNSAAIITIPMGLTILELYCFLGISSVQLNNVLAVLLLGGMGFASRHATYYITFFRTLTGETSSKVKETISSKSAMVFKCIILLLICTFVFQQSKINFMNKYSKVLFCYAILNLINSFIIAPVLMNTFVIRSKPEPVDKPIIHVRQMSKKKTHRQQNKVSPRVYKKRAYPRVQSEISLSTISEEPQSETQIQDVRFDFSIRCY